jgi:hypothetical protein
MEQAVDSCAGTMLLHGVQECGTHGMLCITCSSCCHLQQIAAIMLVHIPIDAMWAPHPTGWGVDRGFAVTDSLLISASAQEQAQRGVVWQAADRQ